MANTKSPEVIESRRINASLLRMNPEDFENMASWQPKAKKKKSDKRVRKNFSTEDILGIDLLAAFLAAGWELRKESDRKKAKKGDVRRLRKIFNKNGFRANGIQKLPRAAVNKKGRNIVLLYNNASEGFGSAPLCVSIPVITKDGSIGRKITDKDWCKLAKRVNLESIISQIPEI